MLDEKLGRQTPELVRRIAVMPKGERDESEGISSATSRVVVECSRCMEDFAVEDHLKALLARKVGGDPATDALKQRLRQSIREIMVRQAILGAEVTVEQDDGGTFMKVRPGEPESRVERPSNDPNL